MLFWMILCTIVLKRLDKGTLCFPLALHLFSPLPCGFVVLHRVTETQSRGVGFPNVCMCVSVRTNVMSVLC